MPRVMGMSAMHKADRLLVYGLPVWSLCTLNAPAWVHIVPALPIALWLARWLALECSVYWQLGIPFVGWCLVSMGWPRMGAVLGLLGSISSYLASLPEPPCANVKYGVGVIDYELSPASEQTDGKVYPRIGRIFYPTAPHEERTPYIAMGNRHGLTRSFIKESTPAALKGKLPAWILSHWAAVEISAKYGADVIEAAPSAPDGRLPVVLFSHGLSSARELHTSLARALVGECGALVIIVEHTDASCALARFFDGTHRAYDAAIFKLGSDPATDAYRSARRDQLAHRLDDLEGALGFLRTADAGGLDGLASRVRLSGLTDADAVRFVQQLSGRLALDHLVVAGHSFGGATALAFAARCASDGGGRLGACIALDPAVDWVPAEYWDALGYDGVFNDHHYKTQEVDVRSLTATPVARCTPCLTVWSESWVRMEWYQRWARRMCGSVGAAQPARSMVLQGAGHEALCDLCWTLPGWLNRILKFTLAGASPAQVDAALNSEVISFVRKALPRKAFTGHIGI